jgi:hypothetical protein
MVAIIVYIGWVRMTIGTPLPVTGATVGAFGYCSLLLHITAAPTTTRSGNGKRIACPTPADGIRVGLFHYIDNNDFQLSAPLRVHSEQHVNPPSRLPIISRGGASPQFGRHYGTTIILLSNSFNRGWI